MVCLSPAHQTADRAVDDAAEPVLQRACDLLIAALHCVDDLVVRWKPALRGSARNDTELGTLIGAAARTARHVHVIPSTVEAGRFGSGYRSLLRLSPNFTYRIGYPRRVTVGYSNRYRSGQGRGEGKSGLLDTMRHGQRQRAPSRPATPKMGSVRTVRCSTRTITCPEVVHASMPAVHASESPAGQRRSAPTSQPGFHDAPDCVERWTESVAVTPTRWRSRSERRRSDIAAEMASSAAAPAPRVTQETATVDGARTCAAYPADSHG